MFFLIVTHAGHKINHKGQIGAYAPYVREMNLWLKHVSKVVIIAPLVKDPFTPIDLLYIHPDIKHIPIPALDFTSFGKKIRSAVLVPKVLWAIVTQMRKADHIHLRCPGNIGLLGCFAQIFFPKKKKTAKYAGNWDFASQQPFTYRIQQYILSNTFLTKNIHVLVYGNWPGSTKNILPFFTASYSDSDKVPVQLRTLATTGLVQLLFVGTLGIGKQPLLSVIAAGLLARQGYNVILNMYGEGAERPKLEAYIHENKLQDTVRLHGNQSADVVKEAFKTSHFLLFLSKSEGWPKVVAESMFWGCVPITTAVSCVPEMLGGGTRGSLVKPDVGEVVKAIQSYLNNEDLYSRASENGMHWARQFTLERFEEEIARLV